MLLSNIAAAVVCLVCILGLLRLLYVVRRDLTVEIEKCRAKTDTMEKTIMTLTQAVDELYGKLSDKVENIAEREAEIRKWDEGIANILNYSLDVARGERR